MSMSTKGACAALAALMFGTASPSAQAASFNCDKAETTDEKAICADRELDDQDVELSVLYTQLKLLLAMGARGDLEDEQVAWLKRRQACGSDRACLSKAYADRLLQLRTAFDELAKRGPF
jgi:uncharacterized protein